MSENNHIEVLNLGTPVKNVMAKLKGNEEKLDAKKVFEHFGSRIATISMMEIEQKLVSHDPEERKEGRDLLKIMAPKMYQSKESEKEIIDTSKTVDADVLGVLKGILNEQKKKNKRIEDAEVIE
jgi:two-component sensor histidine kinase